jgi:hypothetical protein
VVTRRVFPGYWTVSGRYVSSRTASVAAAVAEAEERLMITQAQKTLAADERPVRRREPG